MRFTRNPLQHNGLRGTWWGAILKGNIAIEFLKFEVKDEDLQMIDFYKWLPSDTNVTTEEIYKTVGHNNILDMLAKKYE